MTSQTMSQPTAKSDLVKQSLRFDSIFVAASGILLAAAPNQVVKFLGVGSTWLMIGTGVLFLLYAVDIWWISSKEPINRRWALVPPILNAVWVIASAVILFTNWLPLTTAGWWAVAIVADIVAIIAAVQFYALWRR